MFTRQQYLANECTHYEYYQQFADYVLVNLLSDYIGIQPILDSTDDYFNDIPLHMWDKAASMLKHHGATQNKLARYGDTWSLAAGVCMLKCTARVIKQRSKG